MRSGAVKFLGILAVTGILLTAGCAPMRTAVPEQVPDHAKAAVNALVMRLRGMPEDRVEAETAVRGSGLVAPQPGFRYRGFSVRQVKFTNFQAPAEGSGTLSLSGYLHFADDIGRSAAAAFSLRYAVAIDDIVFESARVEPLYPRQPRIESYVIPLDRAEAALAAAAGDHAALHARVSGNALPARGFGQLPAGAGDYVIFVFSMDRLGPGAEFEVLLSTDSGGTGGYGGDTRYLISPQGWAAALVGGSFSLGGGQGFYVKVNHAPAAGGRKETVALFSTGR